MKKLTVDQLKEALLEEVTQTYESFGETEEDNPEVMRELLATCTTVEDVVEAAQTYLEGLDPYEVAMLVLRLVVDNPPTE